jgi:hypothetical protein
MVLGAPLPTVAHEELSLETGVAALGRLAAAACAGVGAELGDTPLVASELLRLVRAELDWAPAVAEGTKIGIVGLSGSGSDLKTVGNWTTLKPSWVKPGWMGKVSSKLIRGAVS